ncbi:OPT superfamily oligopeptide transporter [Sarocladium strictum]
MQQQKDPGVKDELYRDESYAEGDSVDEDKFRPMPDVETYDGRRILTIRAVLTGIVLGNTIGCANIYLGLKAGFGADATLFSAIFGFIICKGLEKSRIPFLSGRFGPHENNIIQATALGCIGIGFMFVSGVPALYQLGLLRSPSQDMGTLICLSLVAGFWGLGFAVPFRSVFILRLARQLSLVFPYGTASAVTIRTLHAVGNGTTVSKQSRDNAKAIVITFVVCLVWSVGSSFAPGVLYTWSPFWWIYKWGGSSIIAAVSWGWISWSWAPSMIGTGMLLNMNVALSFVLGTVIAWGILGPITVSAGVAVGIPGYLPDYPDLITYNAFIPDMLSTMPSPRYWVLWPAVFLLLGCSLTLMVVETRGLFTLLYRMVRIAILNKRRGHQPSQAAAIDGSPSVSHPAEVANLLSNNTPIVDPVPPQYQVRQWEWISVTVATFILALVSLRYLMHMDVSIAFFNLALGFLWSFVVIHTMGTAGITPIATVAKGSQFITGSVLQDSARTNLNKATISNLSGALVSSAATQQSAELCQDFRTGFLLGTPARAQWHAQMVGTLSACFISPSVYLLFSKAFPCIHDVTQAATCQFAMPSATAWRIITEAVLMPKLPIVQSSWICSIVFAVLGIGSVLLKRWLQNHSNHSGLAKWVPNMSIAGLAMTIPGTSVVMSLLIGTVGTALWKRYHISSHTRFIYPVAAGAIAGEGIAYVIQAALQIGGVGGAKTNVGCVGDVC